MQELSKWLLLAVGIISLSGSCSKGKGNDPDPPPPPPPPAVNEVDYWLTRGDQGALLQKQSGVLSFGTAYNSYPNITVDTTERYQDIDGFGYPLTSGSATLLYGLNASPRTASICASIP